MAFKYDLEQRTFDFSLKILNLCYQLPRSTITSPLISQLVRSGTSIGANYCEANGAISRKDFRNKIYICKKEAKETVYWLRLISSMPIISKDIASVLDEADQLARIFNKISQSVEL